MKNLPKIKNPPTLKLLAYNTIKNAIISQKLQPGIIYNEKKLADEMGISKTPVREALMDLASKGFVTFIPRKGIMINQLDKKDIINLYEVREALEVAAVKLITKKISDEDIQKIKEIHNKGLKAVQSKIDSISYLKLDREFHSIIAKLTGNNYLKEALENIRDLIDWMGMKALTRQARMKEVEAEHHRIVEMIEKRDVKKAMFMMELHIEITKKKVLERIFPSQQEEEFYENRY
ncbi:MAG: GntR family transcriptional regulator [Deltaproteobacteria bacterium]|nr:GntR family transcriptional regulator [Deltaproteobacteria bacterium]